MTSLPYPATRRLAEFASNLKYQDIAEKDLALIKLNVLDTIGCGIYGSTRPWARLIVQLIEEVNSNGPSTVWCRKGGTHPTNAVLANGTFVHGSELDDTHQPTLQHLGAVGFTSALASAEYAGGISGKELLTAIAAAYECQLTLRSLMGRSHVAMGWNGTGACGTVGGALAAGKILGLDAEGLANAIGIAGSCPCGLQAGQKSMVKRTFPGRAGYQGILGAILAKKGFTGTATLLEETYGGFCSTLSAVNDFDVSKAREVGKPFKLSGMGIKAYPFGIGIHTSLDALKEIMREKKFSASSVESVVVRQSPLDAKYRVGMEPRNYGETWSMEHALMSMHYAVAALLVDGDVFIEQLTEAKVKDSAILDMANRVELVADPSLEQAKRGAAVVEVHLRNGTTYKSGIQTDAKGTPSNPMTAEEVRNKFVRLAGTVFDESRIRELERTVMSIEQTNDIDTLTGLLIP